MDSPKTPRLVLLAVCFCALLTACKGSDDDRTEMEDNATVPDAEAGDAETRDAGDAETRDAGDAETREAGDAETRDAGDAGDTSARDAQVEAGQMDSGMHAGNDAGMTGREIDGSSGNPPPTDSAIANNTDGASSSTGEDASAEQDASADAAVEPSADAGGIGPLEDAAAEDASPDAGGQIDGGAEQPDGAMGEVLVESSFEQDAEGWTIIGDAQGSSGTPAYEGTDGNPGGCIRADDDSIGDTWYFTAPASYLGDRSETLGRYLSFDLKTTDVTNLKSAPDVLLEGGGLTIAYDATPDPGADWTPYRILLSAEGWRLNNLEGIAVTDEQFASVLSSLTALRIRGEFNSGPDTGSLDNVEFGTN